MLKKLINNILYKYNILFMTRSPMFGVLYCFEMKE